MHFSMIIVSALLATVSADPAVILSRSLLPSDLTSAALVAPAATPVVAPVSQVASYASVATYPSIAAVSPLAPLTQVLPSYTYQDYFPVVNSALSLPYSLPYAYAADWYYRK